MHSLPPADSTSAWPTLKYAMLLFRHHCCSSSSSSSSSQTPSSPKSNSQRSCGQTSLNSSLRSRKTHILISHRRCIYPWIHHPIPDPIISYPNRSSCGQLNPISTQFKLLLSLASTSRTHNCWLTKELVCRLSETHDSTSANTWNSWPASWVPSFLFCFLLLFGVIRVGQLQTREDCRLSCLSMVNGLLRGSTLF